MCEEIHAVLKKSISTLVAMAISIQLEMPVLRLTRAKTRGFV